MHIYFVYFPTTQVWLKQLLQYLPLKMITGFCKHETVSSLMLLIIIGLHENFSNLPKLSF